jgi:hypothetical protein
MLLKAPIKPPLSFRPFASAPRRKPRQADLFPSQSHRRVVPLLRYSRPDDSPRDISCSIVSRSKERNRLSLTRGRGARCCRVRHGSRAGKSPFIKPRDAELAADIVHRLAFQKTGDKPETLVHHRTLLPGRRYLPPSHVWREVLPMCPVQMSPMSGPLRFKLLKLFGVENDSRYRTYNLYYFPTPLEAVPARKQAQPDAPPSRKKNPNASAPCVGAGLAVPRARFHPYRV